MSITEKDKDMTADYKDTEVTAFLKKNHCLYFGFCIVFRCKSCNVLFNPKRSHYTQFIRKNCI